MKLLIQETVLRIFSTDLTKGFDFIHHSILLDELRSFNIDQTPFFWIRFFLTNRPYIQVIYANQSLSPENITKVSVQHISLQIIENNEREGYRSPKELLSSFTILESR